MFVTINTIFPIIVETQTDSFVYASLTPISDSQEWSEIQQVPIVSEYDQVQPFLIAPEGSLKLLWRELKNEKAVWATYNGVSWHDDEQVNVAYSVRPYIIQFRDKLYSVYYDYTEVFLQTLDESIKSPSQSTSGRTGWDFSAINYRDKIYVFHSVEEAEFGSSQIWLTIYNGESWTTPQQITYPPRFAYLVQAVVANDKIYVVYASGPNLEEIQAQGGGWKPSVYFTYFDGETWSQPEKAFEGAPESLTSYGKGLYLVYSSIGSMKPRLRTFYNGVWSDEELLPIPNTLIPEHGREEIGDIDTYVYQGRLVLVWSRFLVNSESHEGKSSIWFIAYPDQPSEFASDKVEIIDGFVEIDQSSLTGVSVNVSGLSQNGETIMIDTVNYGNTQPLGTGTFEGEVIAFYDIKISPTKTLENDVTAQILITNQKFSDDKDWVISFWNGNSWQSIETSYISPNTISGTLLASDMMGTPIMVGKQTQKLDQNFLDNELILVIAAVTIIVAIFGVIVLKVRKGRQTNKQTL